MGAPIKSSLYVIPSKVLEDYPVNQYTVQHVGSSQWYSLIKENLVNVCMEQRVGSMVFHAYGISDKSIYGTMCWIISVAFMCKTTVDRSQSLHPGSPLTAPVIHQHHAKNVFLSPLYRYTFT